MRQLISLFFLIFLISTSFAANVRTAGGGGGSGSSSTECATAACNLNAATTLNSKNLCLTDGTNCPASSGTNFWTNQAGAGNLGIGTTNNSVGIGTTKGNGVFVVMPTQDGHTNVGIGTWNPSTVLEVIGTGGVGIGTNLQDSGLKIMSGNLGIGTWLVDSGALVITTAAGNVGVGTIRPGTPLDVNGTVRMTAFQLTGNGASSGNVMVTNSVGVGTWMASTTLPNTTTFANPSASVSTSAVNGVATTAMRSDAAPQVDQALVPTWTGLHTFNKSPISIVTAANVGVGSANPGTPLDVAGTIRSTAFTLTGNGAAAGSLLTSSSTVGIGTWMAISSLGIPAGANPSASVSTAAVNGSAATFMRSDGAPQIDQAMAPTWTGLHTFNKTPFSLITGSGNVGINSAAPGQPLDVAGTIRSTAFILSGNGAASGFILQTSSSVGIGTWVPAPTGGAGTPGGGQNAVQYNNASAFAGSEAVFSFNGTNVGIGTTNGTFAVLDLRGSQRISTNLGIGTTTTNNALGVVGGASIGDAATAGVAAPSNGLLVKGNVGIATLSTSAALHINGSGDAFFGGNVGIGTNQVQTNALNVFGGMAVGSAAYTALTAPTSGLIVTGNVGVGTWTTLNALDVNGAMAVGSFAGQSSAPTGAIIVNGNIGIGTNNPQASLVIMPGTGNGNIGIGTWTPYANVIIATGTVGIGTIRPTQTVEVKGTFSVRGAQTSPFTMKAAANQACNTTCTASQCSGAEDTSVIGTFVSCSDATADNCFCMGP